jgi:hypothetical protein
MFRRAKLMLDGAQGGQPSSIPRMTRARTITAMTRRITLEATF